MGGTFRQNGTREMIGNKHKFHFEGFFCQGKKHNGEIASTGSLDKDF